MCGLHHLKLPAATVRRVLFVFQAVFILTLFVLWISSDTIRHNKSLWVLFFASFPAEFFIALMPHEPILLYFSKFYHPFVVSLVATAGMVLAEFCNYNMIACIAELKAIAWIQENRLTIWSLRLFNKVPFLALLVAGFTPLPFYPFRFLVVLADYPVWKYLLAVFVSRFPRFYLLALLGRELNLPNVWLIVLFLVLVALAVVSLVRQRKHHLHNGSSFQDLR